MTVPELAPKKKNTRKRSKAVPKTAPLNLCSKRRFEQTDTDIWDKMQAKYMPYTRGFRRNRKPPRRAHGTLQPKG
jgi:hypothetical protein